MPEPLGIPEGLARRATNALVFRACRHPRLALPLHFLGNGLGPRAFASFAPAMLRRAAAFEFHAWPWKIRDDIRGRDVLEIGCGEGYQAIGYVSAGVRSYWGVEPKMRWDRDRTKGRHGVGKQPFGWTARQIGERFGHVGFLEGTLGTLDIVAACDVVVLHNVTEHLMDLAGEFERIARALRPSGRIVFHHHSFHCWNGHHQTPRTVNEIVPEDADQKEYLDWAHLSYPLERGGYLSRKLNRIRLDDLHRLVEQWFEIDTWEEQPIDEARGASRLTPEIRARHPEYTERELTTQGVFCRARRRDRPTV